VFIFDIGNSIELEKNKQRLIFVNFEGGGSGPGSSVAYTANCRSIIYQVIKKYNITSMLDAPCGAMTWMPLLLSNLSLETNQTFRYHGVDVVESVINATRTRFAHRLHEWKMSTVDFTQQRLPDEYELIFSRDALQHLPLEKVVCALRTFSQVRAARYLLVGSYVTRPANRNIRPGEYFLIDLTRPPFNLNNYVEVKSENVPDAATKHLLLYDVPSYLRKVDFEKMLDDVREFAKVDS
jgi:hypothetical protein